MKERYDLSSHGEILKRGEAVWLFDPKRKKGVTPKLTRNWKGPYTVIKRINDLVYRIQLGPRTKARVVHRNRLWKYSGQSSPTWLKTTEEGQTSMDLDEDKVDQSANEMTQSTTLVESSADQNHPDADCRRSHPDKQHKTNPGRRSTRQRKPPVRYGQN